MSDQSLSIQKDRAVAIHYTLKDNEGETLDSSAGQEPLEYLQGHHNLVPGLEKALEGMVSGDKKQVSVAAAEGYGEHDENLVQDVPRDMFAGIEKIEVGMEFQVQSQEGHQHAVEVVKVAEDVITIDGNHTLAGETLNFDIEIVSVREATKDEIEHGHIHGESCNH